MTEQNPEYEQFKKAIGTILKADPKIVKTAMQQEKQERAAQRKNKKEEK